jgi:hypothetical protein
MILQFLKDKRDTPAQPPQIDVGMKIVEGDELTIKDEDPLLVRGPDVKTLLEL